MDTIQDLQVKIDELKAVETALHEQARPLIQQAQLLYNQRKPLEEQRDRLRIEESEGSEIDWARLIKSHDSSMVMHRHLQWLLQANFWMASSGTWTGTNEPAIQMTLTKGDLEIERRTVAGIRTLTPLLTPLDDGRVWFKIFEHNLSQFGCFYLKVHPETWQATLSNSAYGSDQKMMEFSAVEEAVHFISENLWYVGPDPDQDLDEDQNEDEE